VRTPEDVRTVQSVARPGRPYPSGGVDGHPVGSHSQRNAVGFGFLMYLTMRAIGLIVGVMILQEFTDPTMILASGGILDKVGEPKVARTEPAA
jgi:hypothetical protein